MRRKTRGVLFSILKHSAAFSVRCSSRLVTGLLLAIPLAHVAWLVILTKKTRIQTSVHRTPAHVWRCIFPLRALPSALGLTIPVNDESEASIRLNLSPGIRGSLGSVGLSVQQPGSVKGCEKGQEQQSHIVETFTVNEHTP
ncbi:hypothetical protein BKA70DRAFT_1214872 [Coprinopsis sp. MPI-PUGE-AT-0042]|nr:hypothetical protein BKA70DRAFT_1214872 [Coprinopsis sp. MPI-PUGE-AT-0042]